MSPIEIPLESGGWIGGLIVLVYSLVVVYLLDREMKK